MLKAGSTVILVANDTQRLAETAEHFRICGLRALSTPCDVSHPEEITSLANYVRNEDGKVDVLVNNVGVTFTPSTPLIRCITG